MEEKYLEKKILQKIDEFIRILIDLSSNYEKKTKEEALAKARELIPILLKFLNGNKVHVEPLFYQLVFEKIPDRNILASFGDFQSLLNEIISESCMNFFEKVELAEPNNIKKEEKTDSVNYFLRRLLLRRYPFVNIYFDYYFRGFKINAYIPEKKIAILLNSNNNKIIKLRYLCEKQGIKLILLNDSKNYREFKNNIFNQLAGNL